jgi:ATP-binding cassette, subfamily B, bacterial
MPIALLQPVALKIVIDSVLGDDPLPPFLHEIFAGSGSGYGMSLLVSVVVLQVVVVILAQLQAMANMVLQTIVGEKINLAFRARLLGHAQRLSFAYHDERGTHDSIYRIQYDATAVQHVAVHSVIAVLTSGVTLIAMIVVMLSLHVQLTLIAMTILPFMFLYARAYSTRMKPRYKDAKKLESTALGVVQEVLTSFRVVKAFGREEHEEQRFIDRSTEGVRARIRLGLAEGLFGLLVGTTTAIGTAAVIFFGVQSVQAGTLTLGALLMIVAYLGQLYGPVKTMGKSVAGIQKQLASAERAFELLDEAPHVAERPDARPIERAAGEVEFQDVSFAYEPGQRILDRVSFRVESGGRVGVVGRTGAGKTTLVSLLTRFYDPDSGLILLDAYDLESYRLADLRRQFSIVLQDPVLFSSTIAANIAYARPDAAMKDIVSAATAAGVHGFVTGLPNGYETMVGERGMRLSGGERQRISLARAFLKDAPILILDEPTSSVDVQTEASIMEAMHRLMDGRTTFMIAHRLSTLDACDLILRLEDGDVHVERRA